MSLYAYRLAGKAQSAAPDYIPSLIGIEKEQVGPAGTDIYFEQIEVPVTAADITHLAGTRWVTYDSFSPTQRDPILAVRAGTLSFYIPMSELEEASAAGEAESLLSLLSFIKTKGGVGTR